MIVEKVIVNSTRASARPSRSLRSTSAREAPFVLHTLTRVSALSCLSLSGHALKLRLTTRYNEEKQRDQLKNLGKQRSREPNKEVDFNELAQQIKSGLIF